MRTTEDRLRQSDWWREPTRALDAVAFFATACGVFLFIVLLATKGIAFLETDVLPPILAMSEVLGVAVAVTALFMLLPRRTRSAMTLLLSPASILLAFAAWSYAFMLCERIAGPAAVAVGFALGAIGMLPIGLGAALFVWDLQAAVVLVSITGAATIARMFADYATRNRDAY